MDSAPLETLKERNVANVLLLDGLGQLATKEQTADHAYVRFHVRNADIWFGQEKEVDHRLDRYDYLYEEKQLEPWVPRINEAAVKAAKVRVYFNNHARAKAIKNLFQLMDMPLGEHESWHREIKLQNQFTLGKS
jgi:uncharacterized protein YecE (DUF72 family)